MLNLPIPKNVYYFLAIYIICKGIKSVKQDSKGKTPNKKKKNGNIKTPKSQMQLREQATWNSNTQSLGILSPHLDHCWRSRDNSGIYFRRLVPLASGGATSRLDYLRGPWSKPGLRERAVIHAWSEGEGRDPRRDCGRGPCSTIMVTLCISTTVSWNWELETAAESWELLLGEVRSLHLSRVGIFLQHNVGVGEQRKSGHYICLRVGQIKLCCSFV